MTIDAYILNGL